MEAPVRREASSSNSNIGQLKLQREVSSNSHTGKQIKIPTTRRASEKRDSGHGVEGWGQNMGVEELLNLGELGQIDDMS